MLLVFLVTFAYGRETKSVLQPEYLGQHVQNKALTYQFTLTGPSVALKDYREVPRGFLSELKRVVPSCIFRISYDVLQ